MVKQIVRDVFFLEQKFGYHQMSLPKYKNIYALAV